MAARICCVLFALHAAAAPLCAQSQSASASKYAYTYADLIRRLYDLERLATPPAADERSGNFSSCDRAARYDAATGRYENWHANRDGIGYLRKEGEAIVAAEIEGPGVIWRVWSAKADGGHIKIYIDGAEKPVLDIPFRDYFNNQTGPFAYPALVHELSRGKNSFIPIAYQKSCKVVLDRGWGMYYQITYSTFPAGTRIPSFQGEFDAPTRAALERAQQAFSDRGRDPKPARAGEEWLDRSVKVGSGASAEVCRLSGPRAISRILVSPIAGDKNPIRTLRELTLSITWDDDAQPSVWTPLGDFFGTAPGINVYAGLPAGMTKDRFYSYWFMPFAKQARLTVTNDGATQRELAFRVLHHPLPSADQLLRFHAKWHRDSYAGVDEKSFRYGDRWPDWPLLVTEGAGRFCGVHLHVWNPNPFGRLTRELKIESERYPFRIRDTMKQATLRWWWGEGDEKFFVDGEKMPSTFGTGSEDYFGYAWAAHNPVEFSSALQNQPLNKQSSLGHVSNNRFQIADSVPFQTRFEAVMEKYHPNSWPLLYACTAYWYQKAGQSDPYGPVPAAERVDYYVAPERQMVVPEDGIYEAESDLTRADDAGVQGMRHFGAGWSGDEQLLWNGEVGDSTTVEFGVKEASIYTLSLRCTKAPDYGIFQVSLNGKPIGKKIDLYASRVLLGPIETLGDAKLKTGVHRLEFKLVGFNPKAKPFRGKRYLLGLDYLRLENRAVKAKPPKARPAPQAPRKPYLDSQAAKGVGSKRSPKATPSDLAEIRPLLRQHCIRCHGGGKKVKGKVNLAKLTSNEHFLKNIELTRKIVEALAERDMPPEDEEQPPDAVRERLVRHFRAYVHEYLASSAAALNPIVMRRLNRYEYSNAVRDLLGLKGDIYPLPERALRAGRPYFDPASGRFPDKVRVGNRPLGKFQVEQQILTGVVPFAIDLQAEHGFNNRGEELSFSPILLEAFLKLGQSIVHSPEFDRYSRNYDALFSHGAIPENLADDEKRRRILAVAGERIEKLMERAFRAPVDPETLTRYRAFFLQVYKESGSFARAMKQVVAAVLSSPRFLYMVERKHRVATVSPLNDYELATRLSFFLWSSIPDAHLLELARAGRLRDPDVLDAQVRRMLRDKRSQALSESFARQWLRLDQLITAVPDMQRFPRYYSRIGCEYWKFGLQMMNEPLLLFESILVEDRSILLLVDSDYSYRSNELQEWCSSRQPFGRRDFRNRFNTNQQDWIRRTLTSRREGGVITSAAVLTMTSAPLRTSPIVRGAWVATVIFNKPPPPPPDTVPEIEADDAAIEAKGLTLRQRLVEHQANPSCASCHSKIDPLGFALENYDAVGRWRDTYRSGLKIDARGELFGEYEFHDIVSFKDAILREPRRFIRAFSEHLLSYALGRELKLADQPAVDQIVERVHADGGRISTVITEVAKSYPFRHKTGQTDQHGEKRE